MTAYEGAPGRTQERGIHYACPCGVLFPARVTVAIDARTDPERAALLVGGRLHRLRCPVCGCACAAELPVVYHDPERLLFALVLPEWARARELEERAALLGRLAEETTVPVPPYVREPYVVYGPAGLRALLDARSPAGAEAPPPPAITPPPASSPAAPEIGAALEDGRVVLRVRGSGAALSPWLGAPQAVRIVLHRMPTYPLCALAVLWPEAPEGQAEPVLFVPLDLRAAEGREILRALGSEFRLEVVLAEDTGPVLATHALAAPLEENARLVASAAEEHWEELEKPDFTAACAAFAEPEYDRLGRKHHSFEEDSFESLRTPAAARLAVGIVGYWCEPANEDYLVLVQSLPLPWWRQIRSRVGAAALELGLALPRPLGDQVVGEQGAASRSELLLRQIANFAEVSLRLKPNDLDPAAEWENWSQLLREARESGVAVDPQVVELARASGRRAQAAGGVEATPLADRAAEPAESSGPIDLGARSVDDLLRLLERPGGRPRGEAALEICARGAPGRALESVFAVLPKLSRAEAVRVIPALVRLGQRAEPHFLAALRTRKSFVRQGAALALGVLGATRAAPALSSLLCAEPTDIWKELARALGDLGAAAIDSLLAAARGAAPEARERLALALAHVAARGVRPRIEALAGGSDPAAADLARRALALVDAAQASAEEIRGQSGPRENTFVRAFSRRFYEALTSRIPRLSEDELGEGPDEDAEILLDSDVLEVQDEPEPAAAGAPGPPGSAEASRRRLEE